MFKKVMLLTVISSFFIGCSSTINLQYKGNPGDMRRYQIDTNMDQTMEMMGNEMNFTTQVINIISEKIDQVDKDGSLNIAITFDSISVHSTSPQMKMIEDKIRKVEEKLKNQEITFRISKLGKIIQSTSVDSIISGQLSQVVNPKQTFSGIFPEFPDKPVKFGDSWTIEKTVPISRSGAEMKMSTKTTYTLIGKEEHQSQDLLKIDYNGSIEFEGEGEQMGSRFFIEGDGDTNGLFFFDEKYGSYQSGESETAMDLTIAVTGGQNMTMPMTQFIKAKTTKIK